MMTMFIATCVTLYVEQENRIGRPLSDYNVVSVALELWAMIELAVRIGDFTRVQLHRLFGWAGEDCDDTV